MVHYSKIKVLLIASLVTSMAIVFLMLLAMVVSPYPFDDAAFDKTRWADASDVKDVKNRAYMLDDLIEQHLLPGMSEGEVEQLLGRPSRRSTADPSPPSSYSVHYTVGFWPFHGMDDGCLCVYFDFAGQFTHTDLH